MEKVNRTLLYWINSLTFLSGALNVTAMIAFSISVSHLTGNLSKVPIDFANGNISNLLKVAGILFAFLAGSAVAGFLIGGKEFKLKKRYGWTFEVMATLLILSYKLLYGSFSFVLLLGFIMGLQNGLFIMYKGTVIRTTHVTGSVTDLGIYIGHYLKGDKSVAWRLRYYVYNIISFTVGGGVGAIGYSLFLEKFFYFFIIGYIIEGAFYFRIRKKYSELF